MYMSSLDLFFEIDICIFNLALWVSEMSSGHLKIHDQLHRKLNFWFPSTSTNIAFLISARYNSMHTANWAENYRMLPFFSVVEKVACSPCWPRTHYVAEDEFELPILLFLLPECSDCSYVPWCQAYVLLEIKPRTSCMLGQHSSSSAMHLVPSESF